MLSHSRWTPRFLRIAPVDAGQQVGKLRRRDRHCFTSNRRPDKSSSLESFCEQACSLAIIQPSHDPQQRRHVNTAINDDPPSVPTHDLNPSRISCSTLTRRCRLPLHKHGHKPDGVGRSKPPLAKRLAPGKQQLVGNPVSSRRRRGLPWAGMALLHNPELRFVRPPTSPAGVDYFQADDLMIVLMHVHKVNQLHPRPASQGGLPRRRTCRVVKIKVPDLTLPKVMSTDGVKANRSSLESTRLQFRGEQA